MSPTLPLAHERDRVRSAASVLLAALILAWPALYNGFPLLYPDSMTYLADGPIVARALFLHQFSNYYGLRSFFYSLVILPLHGNHSPWPIVALQCLLVAYVLRLVVRSILPRSGAATYLLLVLFLSLFTGAAWYSSFLMPDILGPVLYLCVYLLALAGETLSRLQRLTLYPIAIWAVTSHATHMVLAILLGLLLAAAAVLPLRALDRRPLPHRLRGLVGVAAILSMAAAAQLALHGYLYGKPSLNGERPAYLTARIIADGTGRRFLEANCAQRQWEVCNHLRQLSDDQDNFLWGDNGPISAASDEQADRISAEEMPFVLAVVRAYPREQFLKSAANFRDQLWAFGLYGFDSSDWMLAQFDQVIPAARSSYLRSRQARGALPLDMLSDIQFWIVLGSIAGMAALVPLLWHRRSPRLAGLGLVVVSMVAANACVAGVLSVADDRYQCRVIWLIPLLAALMLLDWIAQRRRSAESELA